jgi:hypothetical protein
MEFKDMDKSRAASPEIRPGAFDRARSAVIYSFSWRVMRRNLLIAGIVGCVLSVANQYDVIVRAPLTPSLGLKVLFNFLIPFLVSSISAAVNRRSD